MLTDTSFSAPMLMIVTAGVLVLVSAVAFVIRTALRASSRVRPLVPTMRRTHESDAATTETGATDEAPRAPAAQWATRGAAARTSERQAGPTPPARTGASVPVEYLALYTYLEHRFASVLVLTFEQMEALLGAALPTSASTDPDWWTGAVMPGQRQATAWTVAGRTATPNLRARIVTFERAV